MLALRCLLAAVLFEFCCPWLAAADPLPKEPVLQQQIARDLTARDLASARMALLIEVDRPLQLIDNPLGHDVWELLRQTSGVQKALASPDVDRFRQVAKFIEKSLGGDWRTGARIGHPLSRTSRNRDAGGFMVSLFSTLDGVVAADFAIPAIRNGPFAPPD